MSTPSTVTGERADILRTLTRHRGFLRFTTNDLTDEQAAARTTVSELCLGGLIKHVTAVERQWARFIVEGPPAPTDWQDGAAVQEWMNGFKMLPGETLAGLLADYEAVAAATDELRGDPAEPGRRAAAAGGAVVREGAKWSARQVLLHIIAETSQHSGHADILREAIDGAKTMG